MPRLNPDSRGQIIGLLQANVSQRRLARQFNVSQSTISRLSRKFAVTGSTKDRPRPGAPRVTTRRQDNFIRQRHLRDRFTTAVSTAAGMRGRTGRNISRFTVSRRLKDYGIRCRRPVKGQILTRRHRQLRVRWATDMLRVQRQNRNRVVFSDESRFTLSFADGRLRVYRRRHEPLQTAVFLNVTDLAVAASWCGEPLVPVSVRIWLSWMEHSRPVDTLTKFLPLSLFLFFDVRLGISSWRSSKITRERTRLGLRKTSWGPKGWMLWTGQRFHQTWTALNTCGMNLVGDYVNVWTSQITSPNSAGLFRRSGVTSPWQLYNV